MSFNLLPPRVLTCPTENTGLLDLLVESFPSAASQENLKDDDPNPFLKLLSLKRQKRAVCEDDWLSEYVTPEEQGIINAALIGLYEDGLWNLVDPPPGLPDLGVNQDTMNNLVWPVLEANGQEFLDCIADNYVMGDPPPCPGYWWLSEYVDQATNDYFNDVLIGMYESGEWDMTGPPDLSGEPLGFDEATVNEIIWPALDDALDDGDGALFMVCVAENYVSPTPAATTTTTTTTEGRPKLKLFLV